MNDQFSQLGFQQPQQASDPFAGLGFVAHNQPPQSQAPQSTQQSTQSQLPVLTNPSGGIGTALKDEAVGAGKDLLSTARGTAGLLQGAGKKVLGAFGVDTSNMGFPSLDNSTPQGASVADTLSPKSQGEQLGGTLSTVAQLGTGFASKEGQQGIKLAKQGYDAYKEARGAKLADQELKGVQEVVKPKLTALQEAEAKSVGRGKTAGGLLNKVEIAPSGRDAEMTQFAHEAGVSPSNAFNKNIQLMKDAQKTSADTLRQGLQNAPGSWSRNDVVSSLNKIQTPLTIKSDTTLSKLANNFKKAIVDLTSSATKKPEGLLDLRQGVDNLITKEFPANIYTKDTPVGQYVREVRTALNNMAESKLPEGKLPNGSTFQNEMRRQHLLYDAIDNVAEKAPKAGESARPLVQKAKDFAKKHPVITAGAVGETGHRIITGRF